MTGLISINKPHTTNIFDLIKTIEWRKTVLPAGKYYVYETKNGGGCGMVIGEFEIYTGALFLPPYDISPIILQWGCVDIESLKRYAGGRALYAHCIRNVVKWETPKPITDFKRACPKGYNDATNYACYKDGATLTMCKYNNYKEGNCTAWLDRPPQSWCRVDPVEVPYA